MEEMTRKTGVPTPRSGATAVARPVRRDDEPIRITTAAASPAEDIRARQRRYLLAMAIRTVCFVGAIIAHGWLRWTLVGGALLLPYVAVVMANAAATRSDEFELRSDGSGYRELGGGTRSE